MVKIHIDPIEKRNELIWALSMPEQGYEPNELQKIFKLNPATIWRVIEKKPKGWSSPWVKK